MAQVTKYRCDQCAKEVEDVYLEQGWLKFEGSITRSWGIRSKGRDGDARTDYIGKSSEFCSAECLVKHLDKLRKEKRGPTPLPYHNPNLPIAVADPFKEKLKPWEDPLPDDEPSKKD
jgi:hypothetical protein